MMISMSDKLSESKSWRYQFYMAYEITKVYGGQTLPWIAIFHPLLDINGLGHSEHIRRIW